MALLQSLRYRSFALLWTGQTISRMGDNLYRIALGWWVLEETGSAAAMGTVLIFSSAPMLLFLLVGGVVVDRLPRLRVMVTTDVLSGLVALAVAVLAFTDRLEVWHVYVASIIFGMAGAFFFPASTAVLPDLLPSAALPSANSLSRLGQQLAGSAGPAVGAIIIAIGGTASAFALNSVSFFIAAACLLPLLSQAESRPAARPRTHALHDLREGIGIVLATPWLWVTIALFGLINITDSATRAVALPFLVHDFLQAEVTVLGLLQSMYWIGSGLAAVLLGRLTRIGRRGLFAYGAIAGGGLALVLFGVVAWVPLVAVAALLAGASHATFGLIWINMLQELVPREKLGRVASIDALGSFVLLPLGLGLVGWATDWLGPATLFVLGGLTTAGLALLGLAHPAIRRLD